MAGLCVGIDACSHLADLVDRVFMHLYDLLVEFRRENERDNPESVKVLLRLAKRAWAGIYAATGLLPSVAAGAESFLGLDRYFSTSHHIEARFDEDVLSVLSTRRQQARGTIDQAERGAEEVFKSAQELMGFLEDWRQSTVKEIRRKRKELAKN